MFLSKYLKKQQTAAPHDRAHPLEAVPLRNEKVEERISDAGELHLHGTLPPQGILERAMVRIAGTEKNVQVALDDKGAFFWEQIDGQKNLFAIRRALRNKYQLSSEESKEATIRFIKMLMRRNLIQLKVHPKRNQTT